jgi:hypothetical protein
LHEKYGISGHAHLKFVSRLDMESVVLLNQSIGKSRSGKISHESKRNYLAQAFSELGRTKFRKSFGENRIRESHRMNK